ncbi:MAG: cation:proton antiporter [Actinomycetota bacterium]|nr:cation:proton antiporter [Actinomycetota bacterium]
MHTASVLLELGGVIVGLAVLARLAGRLGIPTIPLYLTVGLAFGRGGILPLITTEEFVEIGAEIGLILLLFMLGLEYTARELLATLRIQAPTGVLDFVLNFSPGVIAGLMLGWSLVASVVLGGVTYVSSSGIIAKLLHDFGRIGNRETPIILSVLVIEDLAMAIYLPILAALLIGGSTLVGLGTALAAIVSVIVVLALALKVDVRLSRMIFSHSDEALLLTILGLTLLMAGLAELFQVSAAVAALLVGIMLSGPAAESARALLSPLRDLFAAIFFAFVGFSLDPSEIPPVLGTAMALGAVSAVTKYATGWWSARKNGVGPKGRARAGATLIARGEFSIAVAGLAVASDVEPDLGPLAVTYVFLLAVIGPIAARLAEPMADRLFAGSHARSTELTEEKA